MDGAERDLRGYMLLERSEMIALAHTQRSLRQLAERLSARLSFEHSLLTVALHELAVERGARDPKWFIDKWLVEHPYRVEQ